MVEFILSSCFCAFSEFMFCLFLRLFAELMCSVSCEVLSSFRFAVSRVQGSFEF